MSMKKMIMALLIMSLCLPAISQTTAPCSTMPMLNQAISSDPSLKKRMEEIELKMIQYQSKHKLSSDTGKIITIPVVVHIIYNNQEENISDQRINDAMTVLYQDFRKVQGTSGFNTTHPLANDSQIEFALASCDPDGNPTTGITRTASNQTVFAPTANDMKFSNSGGHDIWDRDRYLNIWVCDLGSGTVGGVAGFAQFPGGDASTDGIVIQYSFFGAGQRTTTHEIGHWLNLIHIWGDEVCGNDRVDDTPVHQNQSFSCDPTQRKSVCGLFPTDDNYENYMDYSEGCTNMFTKGQVNRMQAALISARPLLFAAQASMTCNIISGLNNRNNHLFSIYPNPAKNYVEIVLLKEYTSTTIRLFDLTGRELLIESSVIDEGKIRMNTTDLNNGIYLLKLSTGIEESVQKMVIAR